MSADRFGALAHRLSGRSHPHPATRCAARRYEHRHPKMRGKVPGAWNWNTGRWMGMGGWEMRVFTQDDIKRWDRWPFCNVGLRTALYHTVDIDLEHANAQLGRTMILDFLGWAPTRGRPGSNRILLPYRLADGEKPSAKIRIAFSHPDIPPNPETGQPVKQAFELLGAGQQFVCGGMHPSGVPYTWLDDEGLLAIGSIGLTTVTHERWQALPAFIIEQVLPAIGATLVSKTHSSADGERVDIGNPQLLARDLNELAAALGKIPNERLNYEENIALTHAAKAGSGGDETFYDLVFLPWSLRYPRTRPHSCAQSGTASPAPPSAAITSIRLPNSTDMLGREAPRRF